MARTTPFCIKCGRTNTPLIEGMCPSCWLEENKLVDVPRVLEADYCRFCGSVRIHGKWLNTYDMGEAVLKVVDAYTKDVKPSKQIIESIKVESIEFVTQPSWRTIVKLIVSAKIRELTLTSSYDVEVRLKPSICPRCIMRRSGDYEALIQIRASRKQLSKLRRIVKVVEKHLTDDIAHDIVNVVDNGNRIDVLFFSKGSAHKFVSLMKKYGNFIEHKSYEDVGIGRGGSRRRRMIISLHLKE